MLSGKGNENGEKTTIGLISKKATFDLQHTFFYISLPLFCMTTTWNFQKLSGYTFYGGNVVRVLVHIYFFHCCSFSPWWQLAFLIFSLVQLNSKYIQNYSKDIQNHFIWNILLKSLRLKISISLAFLILSGSPFHSFRPRK